MKTALLSAILGLCFVALGVPAAVGAEVPKAPVAALPAQSVAIEAIASLADPAKLATLGERGANPRVQKITYWLFVVRQNRGSLEAAIDAAFASFGWKGTPQGEETKRTMLLNFKRAENLGCFDEAGLAEMKRGHSPTVKRGQFIGQEMSVDHVLPRALVPELDNVLANLELMPLGMNMGKSAKVEERERIIARRFVAAGLISPEAVPWAAPFDGKPKPSAAGATRTTPVPAPEKSSPASAPAALVGSSRSPVFHKATCASVAKLSAKNLVTYGSRDEAIQAGKRPCPHCDP